MARYYTNGSSALAPEDPRKKFQVVDGGKNSNASRPNFQVINGGNSHHAIKPKPSTGVDVLLNSEKHAIGQNYGRPSFYSGSGKTTELKNKGTKTKFLGSKKTLGAMLIIMCLIGGGGAFLSSSHSLLGPAIMSNVTEQTTDEASFIARALRLVGYSTKGTAVTTDAFPASYKYATMSDSFKARLTQQGFTVSGSNNNISVSFKGETIAADDWSNFYRTNADGREAFNNARLTSASNFYDDSANQTLRKFGLDRNIYKDYKQTGDREVDLEHFDDTMINRLDTSSSTTDIDGTNQGKRQAVDDKGNLLFDENGNPVLVDADDVTSSAHADTSSKTTAAEAKTKANTFISDVAGKVQQVTNWACTALKVGNLIAVAVAANEMYQTMNYFMGLSENASKMMAGYGEESAYNEYMNFLTTTSNTTVEDYAHASINGQASSDSQGSLKIEIGEKEENKSPIEAEGMQLMLAGVNPNKQNTENYSLERASKVLAGALTTSVGAMTTCAVAQGSVALISLAVSLIPGVGQVHIAGQFLFRLGSGILVTTAITAFLGFMIPTVAKSLFTNMFVDLKGLPAGELYAKGAYAANSRIGRTGSAKAASSDAMIASTLPLRNEMATLAAESDRRNRSPFDISSRNTFLGSIAYNLFPLIYKSNTSSVNTLLTTTSNSIASLGGQTSAMTSYNSKSYITQRGSCPNLESIKAVGDIYCNPIVTTDVSTIDVAPNDPEYVKALEDQFEACDEEGDCEIKENSDLAKYVTFCTNRDSPFGIVDSNILNELSNVGVVANFFGSLPIAGDLIDLITAAEDLENMRWANGEKCVASESNPDWSRFKYFQRYIEDMRLVEQVNGFAGESNDKDGSNDHEETTDAKVTEEHTTVTIPGLKNKYKIAWVSDLHMIADGTDYVDQARYDMFKTPDGVYSADYLNSIINHLNNGNFDAVIFGGDMIDYYSNKNYETLRAGLAKLNMPWFYIYGSEDHDKYTGRTNDSVASDLSSDSAAGSGDVIDLGELKIIGLNNSSNKNIGSSELDPVTNSIQNAGKPVLLATHVPFASKIDNDSLKASISNAHNGQAYYWTDGSSNWELSANQAMQNFLNTNIYDDNTNVKGVFAGHVHTLSNDTKLTNSINQHIFKGSFGGSIGVIDIVGDNTAQTRIVDYDIPSRNPVTAYMERYEAAHPTDNSPEGYLARISGLTKDDASLVLDIAAYYDFVNNYDASTRLAMNGDASNIQSADAVIAEAKNQKLLEHPVIGDGEATEEYVILISQSVVYADVRNRSYAV